MKTVMFVLSPIATPIARLLDRILHDDNGGHGSSGGGGGGGPNNDISGTIGGTGVSRTMNGSDYVGEDVTEGNYYNRTELSALVRIQYESQLADKRRRKQQQSRLLLSQSSALNNTGGGQKQRPNPTLETMSSHISKDSIRSTNSTNHSHNSIRAISRQLTSSPGARPSVTRMPSIHR